MALTVEDGSIVSGANSYATVADTAAFFSSRGFTTPEGGYEPLLLLAMDALNGLDYRGQKTSEASDLPFPRKDVSNLDGVLYSDDSIPPNLRLAQMWLARHISEGSDPGAVAERTIKMEKVDVLEIEYATATSNEKNVTSFSDLPRVYNLLYHLIRPGSVGFFRTSSDNNTENSEGRTTIGVVDRA